MRGKKLLAAFLLGVGLCFVPALGCGDIKWVERLPDVNFYMNKYPDDAGKALNEWQKDCSRAYPGFLQFVLLQARVNYIMKNPTKFLEVTFYYMVIELAPYR